jgi:hypothetical protein
MDIPAYLPRDKWLDILAASGLDEPSLLARYDLVLHLTSAANGAEAFYTTANNAARTETAEQARELDDKMVQCYSQHHNHCILPNEPGASFSDKMAKATAAVLALVQAGADPASL